MKSKKFKCYFYKENTKRNIIVLHYMEYENEELLNKDIKEKEKQGFHYATSLEEIDLSCFPDYENKEVLITGIYDENSNDGFIISKEGRDMIIDLSNCLASMVKKVNVVYDTRDQLNIGSQMLKNAIESINDPNKLCVSACNESNQDPPSIALINAIDNLVELTVEDIKNKDFSPLEKIVAILAIAQKLVINDPNLKIEDGSDAGGNIYEAISRNNILCQGYDDIFVKFATKLGIEVISELGTHIDATGENHAVSIAYIEDPKYGINGKYLFDLTPSAIKYSKLINEQRKKTPFMIGVFCGMGKDICDLYEEHYGGKISGGFNKIKSSISDKSIPLEILKEASKFVESKFIFDTKNITPKKALEASLDGTTVVERR